ncbi:MAG TPA: hypothetical protein VGK93_13205 [Candidatus Eisenbacteria bacterium]|jgi:hypothetical protein
MKRASVLLAIVAVAMLALGAYAEQAAKKNPVKTITGELIDTGCYLGHGAHGADHVGCATKCIAGGMPMGLLTKAGALYLLTLNHDNPDPYNQLKEMAGKTVSVTGEVMMRSGMKGIDVTEAKEVSEAAVK